MNVALAAAWTRRDEMAELALCLQIQLGIKVTSSWVWEHPPDSLTNKYLEACATQDLRDIRDCDYFVRFSDNIFDCPTVPSHLAAGGRMVEMGYALALGKPIIVVGGRQNLYDHLIHIKHVKDVAELKRVLSAAEVM